jgi:putative two-component system response regulator
MSLPDEKTALIVDDEEIITDMVCDTLVREGFRCRKAHNAHDALVRLAEEGAAFLLTDVRMPGMNGLDLMEQVRNHYPDTFILLFTGSADVPMVVRALRSGASDFLTKPFSLSDLRERMQIAFAQRAARVRQQESERFRARQVQHLDTQYRTLSKGILTSLGAVLKTKHPATQEHSQRVALMAANLAAQMQRGQEEIEAVYVAGLLHDIGKVAVDATILDKSGKLNQEEFDQIRAHPVESARIVAPLAISPLTIDAVRHHHERYDGSGYPDHLAGEAIPLSARILAVCDAFDAITSERTYSPALPTEEGVARLRSGAGTQFDPSIVEAFCTKTEQILPSH